LKMAKDARPGQRNNLDALCRHFGIDNSKRTLHGALLDAELLAEVYMAMTRGQDSLLIDLQHTNEMANFDLKVNADVSIKVVSASTDELLAHETYIEDLDKSGGLKW
jgi:DNA polymerase III subunit epsilon